MAPTYSKPGPQAVNPDTGITRLGPVRAVRWAASSVAALWLLVCSCSSESPPVVAPAPPTDPVEITAPGFPPLPIPPDNPTTRQGIDLGRRLFYDPILSSTVSMSCASCHAPEFAFTDHANTVSTGVRGLRGRRNAPSLTNIGWNLAQFWEGRRTTLEEQAGDPVPAHDEMDLPWDQAVGRVATDPRYPPLFRAAFGTPEVSRDRIVKAIAQFERTMVSVGSRYDTFLRTRTGFTASERRGYVMFFNEKADCFHCHVDKTFTDFGYQNNGLDSIFTDTGRMMISGDSNDLGKFKTPTLRNLAFTAPYMHDARFATLQEVIDHYDLHAKASPTVNPFIRVSGRTLGLTAQDKQDLLAFLLTLTDSAFVNNAELQSPFGP